MFICSPAMAIRAGLRALLGDETHIQIVGEAAIPEEIEVAQDSVDVLIWSPTLSVDQETILSELRSIKIEADTALLLIHNEPDLIDTLAKIPVRAWGLIPQEFSQGELIAAVEALNEGLAVSTPGWLKEGTASRPASDDEIPDLIESLTSRELETLQLLALGLTNKQIAVKLGISSHTVKFHVSSIFNKMGTTNRTETVKLGLKMGLILL